MFYELTIKLLSAKPMSKKFKRFNTKLLAGMLEMTSINRA